MIARRFWSLPLVLGLLFAPALAKEPDATSKKSPQAVDDEEYELQRMLVDTLDQVERNYVKTISRRELIEAAIDGILRKLDPYSTYIAPDDLDRFRGAIDSRFGGIGVQVTVGSRGLTVLSPLVNTPAHRAGILAGDRIIAIDGRSTEGVDLVKATEVLKGKIGTKVALSVLHPGQTKPKEVTLTRELIQVETVLGDRRKDDNAWDFMVDHPKRIGYVRVTAFSRSTADELRAAVQSLQRQNFAGLVLDLRFNPGGLLSSAIEVSDLFIEKGRIVSTTGRNVAERVWDARSAGTLPDFPMVVLVNRFSASASEIVAACLQDHHRAVIMGERTWGKGSVQNVIPLEHGHSALKLTTSSYHRPSGKNINRSPGASEKDDWGVTPDKGFAVETSPREVIALVNDLHRRDILKPSTGTASKPDGPATKGDSAASDKLDKERGEKAKAPPAPADRAAEDRVLRMAIDYLSAELVRTN
jgi:carboxyl-terminal processing protease